MLGISETSSVCPAVTWPLLLTVTLVYVPALSPDRAASTSWSRTSAEPSKLTASAVASPAAENARGVFRPFGRVRRAAGGVNVHLARGRAHVDVAGVQGHRQLALRQLQAGHRFL